MATPEKKTEFKIPKQKLDELLADVQGELNQILKSEEKELTKAAKDDEPAEESSGSSAGAPAEDLAPEESSSAPPAEATPPAPEATPPAPEASAPAAPEATPAPEESAPPTMEELMAAYAALPPDQFQMHAEAVKAVEAQMGAAAAPPAPAPEASPAPPPMGKTEAAQVVAAPKGNGGQMSKSEKDAQAEIASLKAELAQRDEALNGLVEKLSEKINEIPLRKSVKGISEIETPAGSQRRVEDMTKAEVTQLLREKARDTSLSKSDRELIVGFYNKRVPLEKLSHLLADAK